MAGQARIVISLREATQQLNKMQYVLKPFCLPDASRPSRPLSAATERAYSVLPRALQLMTTNLMSILKLVTCFFNCPTTNLGVRIPL